MVKPDPKIDIKTRLIGIQTVIKCYAKHITISLQWMPTRALEE